MCMIFVCQIFVKCVVCAIDFHLDAPNSLPISRYTKLVPIIILMNSNDIDRSKRRNLWMAWYVRTYNMQIKKMLWTNTSLELCEYTTVRHNANEKFVNNMYGKQVIQLSVSCRRVILNSLVWTQYQRATDGLYGVSNPNRKHVPASAAVNQLFPVSLLPVSAQEVPYTANMPCWYSVAGLSRCCR